LWSLPFLGARRARRNDGRDAQTVTAGRAAHASRLRAPTGAESARRPGTESVSNGVSVRGRTTGLVAATPKHSPGPPRPSATQRLGPSAPRPPKKASPDLR
jgi:hypothetical protein